MTSNDDLIWERSPHTAVKHQILQSYLGAWFAKLAWARRIVFIDGFAGPGRYKGGEEGSPLIALRMAIEHQAFRPGSKFSACERVLVFIEKDQPRFAHLQQELESITVPSLVKVATSNDEFEVAFGDILDQSNNLAPTFVMIDPFGWTGFPYSLIERLGQHQRSEVMVSFMLESINRFLAHSQQEENWNRLFGNDEWRRMPASGHAQQRREFLTNLYKGRLRDAGFEFQWQFELRDEGNRPEYYLIYGSQSDDGLAAMKESMWKVAPDGSFRYSDYEQGGGQFRLFVGDPAPAVLAKSLQERFAGKGEIDKRTMLLHTLTSTDFVQKHLNATLRSLEGTAGFSLRRPPGKRKSYFEQVWATFS